MGIQENILSIDLESWVYPEIPKYRLMSSEEKKILDNGYLKRSIVYLLEILEKTNNSATFFVVADQYNWDKEIIKLIRKNGHEIGYHTHTHTYLKNENDLSNQINLSTNFIEEIKPKGFRSPMLNYKPSFDKIIKKFNFKYTSNYYSCEKNYEKRNELKEIFISMDKIFAKNKSGAYNLNLKNFFKNIYFGSPFFFPILSLNFINKFIKKQNSMNLGFHIFFHNWQIIDSKSKVNSEILRLNPFYFPYTINIQKKFEKLLYKNNFTSIEKFFGI